MKKNTFSKLSISKLSIKGFWVIVVALFLVLVVAQVVMGFSGVQSNDPEKGKTVGGVLYLYSHGTLKVRTQVPEKVTAQLLLNGVVAQNINQDEIRINVKEGDLISVLSKGNNTATDWNLTVECQGIGLRTALSLEKGVAEFLIHKGINTLGTIQ